MTEQRLNLDRIEIISTTREGPNAPVKVEMRLSRRDADRLLRDPHAEYSLSAKPTPVQSEPMQRAGQYTYKGPCMECGALVTTGSDGVALSHRDKRQEAPTEIIWCSGQGERVATKGECFGCGQLVGVGCWGKYDWHTRYEPTLGTDVRCEGAQQFYVQPDDLPPGLVVQRPPRLLHLTANKRGTKGLCGAKGLSPKDVHLATDVCHRCTFLGLERLAATVNTNAEVLDGLRGVVNNNANAAEKIVEHVKALEDRPASWIVPYDEATLRIEHLEKQMRKVKRHLLATNLLKRVRRLERKGEAQDRATKMIAGGGKP